MREIRDNDRPMDFHLDHNIDFDQIYTEYIPHYYNTGSEPIQIVIHP